MAFAREESDQALAFVCGELAALMSAAGASTQALMSALADMGSNDDTAADEDTHQAQLQPAGNTESGENESEQAGAEGTSAEGASGAEEAVRRLRAVSEAGGDAVKRLSQDLLMLRAEREHLATDLAEASGGCWEAERRAEALTERLAAATSAAERAAQRAQRAEQAAQLLEQQQARLTQELEGLRGSCAALETSRVQLEARLSMLQQAKDALEDALEDQERTNGDLEEQVQQLQEDLKSLRAISEEGEAARAALQGELSGAVASLGAERSLRAQAQEELAEARQAGISLERQLEATRKDLAKVCNGVGNGLPRCLECICGPAVICCHASGPDTSLEACRGRLSGRVRACVVLRMEAPCLFDAAFPVHGTVAMATPLFDAHPVSFAGSGAEESPAGG